MSNLESIYLCTDSKEIYKVAESLGVPSIMTKVHTKMARRGVVKRAKF